MKTLKKILLPGFSIGVMVGLLMSLIFSYIFAEGQYAPLSPVSTMGMIYNEHFTEPTVMLICIIIWGCIGILFSLIDRIFHETDWSLLKKTLWHLALGYIGFLPLAMLAGWFPLNLPNILFFTLIFIIVYTIIWLINYFKNKAFINEINQHLK